MVGETSQNISASGKQRVEGNKQSCQSAFHHSYLKYQFQKETQRKRYLNAWRLQEEDYCILKQQEPDAEKHEDFLRLKEAACCWTPQNKDEADFLGRAALLSASETGSTHHSEGII